MTTQASNFLFLKEEWQDLWEIAQEAEQYCLSVPRHAANLCRISLETAIHWMYDNDAQLDIPYDKTLFNLMKQPSFENLVPYQIRNDIHAIRQAGNIADHTQQKIAPREALLCVENLHRFLQFFAREYSEEDFTPQSFNEFLVPTSIEDK